MPPVEFSVNFQQATYTKGSSKRGGYPIWCLRNVVHLCGVNSAQFHGVEGQLVSRSLTLQREKWEP